MNTELKLTQKALEAAQLYCNKHKRTDGPESWINDIQDLEKALAALEDFKKAQGFQHCEWCVTRSVCRDDGRCGDIRDKPDTVTISRPVFDRDILTRSILNERCAEIFRAESQKVILQDSETNAEVVCYQHQDGRVLLDAIRFPDNTCVRNLPK